MIGPEVNQREKEWNRAERTDVSFDEISLPNGKEVRKEENSSSDFPQNRPQSIERNDVCKNSQKGHYEIDKACSQNGAIQKSTTAPKDSSSQDEMDVECFIRFTPHDDRSGKWHIKGEI